MSIKLESLIKTRPQIDFEEQVLLLLEKNTEVVKIIDDFESIETIKFTKCGYGITKEYFLEDYCFKMYDPKGCAGNYFGFSFVNENGFMYLDVVKDYHYRANEMGLALGDYFVILFDDGTKIKYTFETDPVRKTKSSSNIIALKSDDLHNFLTKDIDRIKVVSSWTGESEVFCVNQKMNKSNDLDIFLYKYPTRELGQLLL